MAPDVICGLLLLAYKQPHGTFLVPQRVKPSLSCIPLVRNDNLLLLRGGPS